MWTMAVDAVTAEVVSALQDAGIESLLLKGPTIAGWLYDDDSRTYVDTDLLVNPDRLAAAREVLGRLAFEERFGPLHHPGMERPPSAQWQRDAFQVDLHETLDGARAAPHEVWKFLWQRRVEHTISGRAVPALDPTSRIVHIALHAAHHGPSAEKPLRDLRQAAARLGDAEWGEAATAASSIEASAAFAVGLGLVQEGRAVLDRMGIAAQPGARWFLETGDTPIAAGLERLSGSRGAATKLRMIANELVPSREFMRWWSPVARRSRTGLLAAYVWRWIYLARHAPEAVLAWRRARAASTHLRR